MSHWYDSTPKKSRRKRDSNSGSSAFEADALPLGQRGGSRDGTHVCRSRGERLTTRPTRRYHRHTWLSSWGRYHGGRRLSGDDSLHSPTVMPPSALHKPSIMKDYHRRRTCSHTSPRRSPTMVMLHDTRFVECRWWHDGWTVKTAFT